MATQLLMAKSPEEAIGAKDASAVFLAGGTEVNRLGSEIAEKAETLISLKKCAGLKGMEADEGYLTIGAMCTFQEIVESEKTPAWLREVALFMASRTKRNMATIGGNIAAKRSDSYLIPALSAAGAVLEVIGSGGTAERIGIEEYTDKDSAHDSKLILSVTVPEKIKLISKRYANTAQSHAVLTMSAALDEEGVCIYGAVKNVGLVKFCDLERAFKEDPDISEEAVIEMVKTCDGLKTEDDMFGSSAYKRYLIAVTAFDMHKKLTGKEV